ncbi:MAG: DUF917 family protein [Calditrichaeota bacterium]|nr:DUF917 family protein [Calditrichota bacterium]
MLQVTEEIVESAVLGGGLLGGGGGGSLEEGLALGRAALARGLVLLRDIEELPPEATVVTVSLVGAPAAPERCVTPEHFVRAVEILRDGSRLAIDALITSENGGFATVNGWYQSAVLSIPVLDAPCNGRAHPLGLMGSMGLHRLAEYRAGAAAVGGDAQRGHLVEEFCCGSLEEVTARVRQAAIAAGGMVAVARNPVPVSYVRQHAAVGAISQAMRLGAILRNASGISAKLQALSTEIGARTIGPGEVTQVERRTAGGFDVGSVLVMVGQDQYELSFWNEYMTIECAGERLATFPDLIATLESDEGRPLTTAAIATGQRVALVTIPWDRLILGSGMRDAGLYEQAEKAIGKKLRPLPRALCQWPQ